MDQVIKTQHLPMYSEYLGSALNVHESWGTAGLIQRHAYLPLNCGDSRNDPNSFEW